MTEVVADRIFSAINDVDVDKEISLFFGEVCIGMLLDSILGRREIGYAIGAMPILENELSDYYNVCEAQAQFYDDFSPKVYVKLIYNTSEEKLEGFESYRNKKFIYDSKSRGKFTPDLLVSVEEPLRDIVSSLEDSISVDSSKGLAFMRYERPISIWTAYILEEYYKKEGKFERVDVERNSDFSTLVTLYSDSAIND